MNSVPNGDGLVLSRRPGGRSGADATASTGTSRSATSAAVAAVGDLCEEFLFRRLVLSFLTWRTTTATAATAALVALRPVPVSLFLWLLWRFGHVSTHVAECDIRFETTAHGCP